MKKQFSLSRLFHHDKLMMVVSLVLAVVIWALVVYGPSNMEEREITGVPVSITLNDYASQTLNMRIIDGANATATVRVRGLRSVVGHLSAQDITVTADTGNVIKEGTYVLPLRATSSGDYSIVSLVGDDGTSDTVTVTCDVWREQEFFVEVEMPDLTLTDIEKYQFGTPSVSGEAVANGIITVSGPKMDINRISRVIAVIPDEATIQETTVYTADLQALDEEDKVIDTVSFLLAEDAKVSVTVPVMVYRKVTLTPTVLHVPAGYREKKDLVSVTPTEVELWGLPSELDEYVASVQQQIVVDFDQLTPNNLTREIKLEETDAIRPRNGNETIELKVNLDGIATRTLEVPLTEANFKVLNCPVGFSAKLSQNKLPTVTLCGSSRVINQIKPEDIIVTIDMGGKAVTGQQTIVARLSVKGENTVWANYDGDATGIDVLVSVTQP